jgi:small subunit ribosomal protein S17
VTGTRSVAEEEKNENEEHQPEGAESIAEVEPTADVEAEAAEAQAPAEEPAAEAPAEEPVAEAPAEEPATEQPPSEEPPAEEPPAEAPAEEGAAPGDGDEPAAAAQPARKPKGKRKPRNERRQRPKAKRERPETRKAIARLPKPEHARGRRQERRGVVVSSAMDKTIVVKVETVKAHARYKKVIRRSRKFHAHDEQNVANVGDVVRIVETRPLSATKNWRLVEVVEAAR